jgi:hypothetical protein
MVSYATGPNAVDLYARTMAAAFDENKVIAVPTVFQAFFGRPETGAQTVFSPDALDVDIDIIRGNEKIAALVPRGISRPLGDSQRNAQVGRFSSFSRAFPLSIEESDIDANQTLRRLAGDNPYAMRSKGERLRELGLRAHQEQVRRTVRLFEVLAGEALLTGKMSAIVGTTDTALQYDFRRNSNHSITLVTKWDDVGADILGDIDDAWDLGRTNGHVSLDGMLLGESAMEAFIADSDVIAKADNRRFELIWVNQNMPVPPRFAYLVEAGATARGLLRTPKGHEFWMFTYSDVYTNAAGTAVKYMNAKKVLFFASTARCDRWFGPPQMFEPSSAKRQMYQERFGIALDAAPQVPQVKGPVGVIDSRMFYFDAYQNNDESLITIRTQAAPIFAPVQTDAFVVIENAVA